MLRFMSIAIMFSALVIVIGTIIVVKMILKAPSKKQLIEGDSYKEFTNELRETNKEMREELSVLKEKISSIEKMLKEVE
jgi:hypothetical protein